MKTVIIFLAAVTLAIVLGLTTFKNQIALYLFQQNIERQVSWDIRDDLSDGLHVCVLWYRQSVAGPGSRRRLHGGDC